jgi:hypothetical protein
VGQVAALEAVAEDQTSHGPRGTREKPYEQRQEGERNDRSPERPPLSKTPSERMSSATAIAAAATGAMLRQRRSFPLSPNGNV